MGRSTVDITHDGAVATLWLDRPQVRNALDEALIADITAALVELEAAPQVRVVVVAGRGTAFCAGGDLAWMKRSADAGVERNLAEATKLAAMLSTLHRLSKPTIARVHGPAFAGGMGVAAACDIVVADPAAEFCLSEVRIGLVAATISPYVVQALGAHAARRYLLTAERISATEAHRLGFVHELAASGAIDDHVARFAAALCLGGPAGIARSKRLVDQVAGRAIDDALVGETAAWIAEVRASDEGREGVRAFLEKRKPAWQ